MHGESIDKWISVISASDRTSEVAVRSLQNRLAAVLHYLPAAAENAAEDIEHVHQLRVWTRRATAALRLYEELLPHRRFLWMKKQLQRIRRAANEARDCDVLIQRLEKKAASQETERWLNAARQHRAEAQKKIIAVHKRLARDDRFAKSLGKLFRRAASPNEETGDAASAPFRTWAREHLRPAVQRFFSAIPVDHADEAALHQFRIRGKELRYTIELLGGAFPESLREDVYPVVEIIQDRLGEINDLATAKERLEKHVKDASDSEEKAGWRRLLAKETGLLKQARDRFWEWCTPEKLEALRIRFKAVMARQPAGYNGVPARSLCRDNGEGAAVLIDP